MLSHLGLVLLAMVVLGMYLLYNMDWFYLNSLQNRMHDEMSIISSEVGPQLAAGNRDAVRAYLEQLGPNVSIRVMVADADGVIVGSTEPEESHLVGRAGLSYGLSKALRSRIEQIVQGESQPTNDVVYVVSPLDWDGKQVGAIRLSYQLGDLYNQMVQLTTTILVGLAVALAVGLFVSLVLAQSLSAPARRLASAARALSAGNLGYRIRPRGNDEIREAGRAFDALADRMQQLEWSRQQLLGDVSHDLHSSVTGVGMAVEALQRGAVDDPVTRALLLDGLASHSRRLHRMADDLLETARIEAGRLHLTRSKVSPSALLRSVAAEFTAEANQQGVILELEMGAELPAIWADGVRVSQSLGNLLENAIRHTPAGARVILRGEAVDDQCRLSVSDDGPGIAEADLPLLFDRFRRFKQERPGRLGFGLAIAKGLVEAHGGWIEVTSSLGHGAAFTVVLPIGEEGSV
jgi:signal transduction histidine kinase